jgi:hypothetical protein
MAALFRGHGRHEEVEWDRWLVVVGMSREIHCVGTTDLFIHASIDAEGWLLNSTCIGVGYLH